MLTVLGRHRFDVTHSPVVLGRLTLDPDAPAVADHVVRTAHAHAEAGADGLLLGLDPSAGAAAVAAAVEDVAAVGLPVVVGTGEAPLLEAGLSAGACGGHDPTGLHDSGYLPAIASAGATLIVGEPAAPPIDPARRAGRLTDLAGDAVAAGVPKERIVVDVARRSDGAPPPSVAVHAELELVARRGWVAMIHLQPVPAGPDAAVVESAAHAAAIPMGSRLVATDDVRVARRVAAVVEALLRARDRTGASA